MHLGPLHLLEPRIERSTTCQRNQLLVFIGLFILFNAATMVEAATAFDTVLNADAAEFCPTQRHRDLLVCGTYQLQEGTEGRKAEEQVRLGRLWMLRVENSGEEELRITEESSLDVPGIFDIKWSGSGREASSMLGHAAADGWLYLYSLTENESGAASEKLCRGLQKHASFQCGTKPGALALSLDWNDRTEGAEGGQQIAVSLSDGTVCVVQAQQDSSLSLLHRWDAHEMEAWITAWDCHTRGLLYTGADDAALKLWDLRSSLDAAVLQNTKTHQAGVTCMQSHAGVEHCLVTGSYDETIRVFDTRQLRRPVAETQVGGGVWRVKWHPSPSQPSLLAAACMHNGFTVLQYDHATGAFNEAAAAPFQGRHTSLGYGMDWQWPVAPGEDGPGTGGVLASASFYDHLLQVWRFNPGPP